MKRWTIGVVVCLAGVSLALRAQSVAEPPRPASTMQQLMRSVVFINANVVFLAEREDPAALPRDPRGSIGTNPATALYGGWPAVENSSLALADAADLLNSPRRVCANGVAVPVADPRWKTLVDTYRTASLAAAEAARSRNQDRIVAASADLTDSCSACHRVYRSRQTPCVAVPQ